MVLLRVVTFNSKTITKPFFLIGLQKPSKNKSRCIHLYIAGNIEVVRITVLIFINRAGWINLVKVHFSSRNPNF